MEEGLDIEFSHMINDSINHAYVMKSQEKLSGTSWLVNILTGQEVDVF